MRWQRDSRIKADPPLSQLALENWLTSKARLYFPPLALCHARKENEVGRRRMEKGNGVELSPRILIVDDHPAARITIRELGIPFQSAGTPRTAKKPSKKLLRRSRILSCWTSTNGVQAAFEIRRIPPSTKIVFLTVHDGPGFKVGTKPWAHGFVPKSAAGTDLIPTLQRVAGITANEMTIECPHCQMRQKVYAARSEFAQKRSQYVSRINCQSEFDVKAPDKIKS